MLIRRLFALALFCVVSSASLGARADPTSAASQDDGDSRRAVGLTLGAMGVAALAGAAVSRWEANQARADSLLSRANHQFGVEVSDQSRADAWNVAAAVSVVAAAAAIATGAVLYFTAPKHTSVALSARVQGAGLMLVGDF